MFKEFQFDKAFELLYHLVEVRYLSYNVLTDFVMAAFMDNAFDEVQFAFYTSEIKALIKKLHNL